MKAVILARVSTKEQESIPAQLERLNKYIIQKNLEVIQTFEIKESSTKETRKEFEKIIDLIRKSKEPIALITDTVDRLQRSFKESVELDELRRQNKLEMHFYRENLVLGKDSNSSDLLRWDMAVMFAKSYILQLRDNVNRSIDKKLADGEYPGKSPLGYLNINLSDGSISSKKENKEGKKWIVPDPERKHFIVKAFEMYATGQYTISNLAKRLTELGFKTREGNPIAKSTLGDILNDPFYYGEFIYNEKMYKHRYEAIIPQWLFIKGKQVKAKWEKQHFKLTNKEFIFKGLVKCSECHHGLSSYEKKGINYIRCHSCYSTHITEESFVEEIKDIFKKIAIPQNKLEELTTILRTNHSSEQNFYLSNNRSIQAELTKLQNRMETMYDDRLDGRISRENYDERLKKMKAKEQDLLEQQKDHSKGDEEFLICSSYLLELAKRAYELFESSQTAQKRKLVSIVFANLEANHGKLDAKPKELFQEFINCSESNEWLPYSANIITQLLADKNYWMEVKRKMEGIESFIHQNSFRMPQFNSELCF